ncbi:hypothetical protein H0H92_012512 [Tricholoma furcatifolium]|nr:hypothetical protein H0H92_012512 [Tricholoma furcatifolium]
MTFRCPYKNHSENFHNVECIAGQSNEILLSDDDAALARLMLQEAEMQLEKKKCAGNVSQELLYINYIKVALSPVKKLPAEILSRIFYHASKSASNLRLPYPVNVETFIPWTFARVSSLWRRVARSNPSPWNSLEFKIDLTRRSMPRVMFWLENIVLHHYPISLHLQNQLDSDIHQAFIYPLHARLRALSLIASKEFFVMPKSCFPSLENLTLTLGSKRDNIFPQPPFFDMASLRTLHIRRPASAYHDLPPPTIVPWEQLTELTFTSADKGGIAVSVDGALELLNRCINLEICEIGVLLGGKRYPTDTITVPKLRDFTVLQAFDYSTSRTDTILDYLKTPKLESLRLTLTYGLYKAPDIGALVRRSGCMLRSLKVENAYHGCPEIKLDDLSSLHELVVPNPVMSFSPDVLHKISAGVLLPNIKSLPIVATTSQDSEHLAYVLGLNQVRFSSKASQLLDAHFFVVLILNVGG